MAINFYRVSIRAHNITNFIFIAADRSCCELLQRTLSGVACHVQREDQSAANTSKYGDADFIRKMNFRTDAILAVLGSGVSVLHTDTDVIFLRNPLPVIITMCFKLLSREDEACDMAILLDKPGTFNAGFLYVRPTSASRDVYRRMKVRPANALRIAK